MTEQKDHMEMHARKHIKLSPKRFKFMLGVHAMSNLNLNIMIGVGELRKHRKDVVHHI